jgi:transcriptional regulator with XRE-family HTH domain
MNNAEKKDWAQHLYVKEHLSQKEIAKRVGVREATISGWVNKYDWAKLRQSILATKSTELANLYAQLAALNDHIKGREEGQRYAMAKEADTLSKITSSIRSLETETSISEIVDVFMKFNEFVRQSQLQRHHRSG